MKLIKKIVNQIKIIFCDHDLIDMGDDEHVVWGCMKCGVSNYEFYNI